MSAFQRSHKNYSKERAKSRGEQPFRAFRQPAITTFLRFFEEKAVAHLLFSFLFDKKKLSDRQGAGKNNRNMVNFTT